MAASVKNYQDVQFAKVLDCAVNQVHTCFFICQISNHRENLQKKKTAGIFSWQIQQDTPTLGFHLESCRPQHKMPTRGVIELRDPSGSDFSFWGVIFLTFIMDLGLYFSDMNISRRGWLWKRYEISKDTFWQSNQLGGWGYHLTWCIKNCSHFVRNSHFLPWLQLLHTSAWFSSGCPGFCQWCRVWLLPWQKRQQWLLQFPHWNLQEKQTCFRRWIAI